MPRSIIMLSAACEETTRHNSGLMQPTAFVSVDQITVPKKGIEWQKLGELRKGLTFVKEHSQTACLIAAGRENNPHCRER